MADYLVPDSFGEAEYTEKRSRFLGRVFRVSTEEEAVGHIREIREKHWDATHNVYAYLLRDGGIMRYSDDGEPQGTSGLPVLGVFRAAGVTDVCCVVTRYFGGVLLGTGGLVRAYSHTASLALEAAGTAEMRLWEKVRIVCPYALYERIRQELPKFGGITENTEFGAEIVLDALFPAETAAGFGTRLIDLTAGTVRAETTGECRRALRIR